MDPYKTTIERAFELARPGAFTTIAELVARLDAEGYDGRQIHGRTLRKELGDLIKEANVLRTRDAIRAIIPELEKRPLIAFPRGEPNLGFRRSLSLLQIKAGWETCAELRLP